MKRYFNYLFALALVMSMQGCSKDLVVTDEPNDPEKFEEVQLRLTGEVAYMTPETRLDARGGVDGDLFGVYTTTGKMGPNKNSAPKNAKYVYKNGTIEAADDNNMIYWEDGKDLDIYAYYPYDKNNSTSVTEHTFTIPTDQSNESNYYNSDFLRAVYEDVKKTSSPVEMTFYHLMSKVSVTITHDSSFTDDNFNNLTKVLTIEGVEDSGNVNISKGEVAASSKKESLSFTARANGNTFSAIIFPQSRSNVKFRLKHGNDYYSSTMDIAYQSGKEYKYTFTVTKNEGALSLKSTNINEWTVGSEITQKMTKETSSN